MQLACSCRIALERMTVERPSNRNQIVVIKPPLLTVDGKVSQIAWVDNCSNTVVQCKTNSIPALLAASCAGDNVCLAYGQAATEARATEGCCNRYACGRSRAPLTAVSARRTAVYTLLPVHLIGRGLRSRRAGTDFFQLVSIELTSTGRFRRRAPPARAADC